MRGEGGGVGQSLFHFGLLSFSRSLFHGSASPHGPSSRNYKMFVVVNKSDLLPNQGPGRGGTAGNVSERWWRKEREGEERELRPGS